MPLDVKIGVWNFEPTIKAQRAFFGKCSELSRGTLHYEIWAKDQPWQEYLPRCDSQILYFFSHGHTAKPHTLIDQQFDALALSLKQWVEQSFPGESETLKQYRQRLKNALHTLADNRNLLDESYIRLQGGYLLLREMGNAMQLEQSAPLVFLNMCEAAQVFFLKAGSRGVIGTEIPMIDAFADLFARLFFQALFYERTAEGTPIAVGTILFNLRRAFLDRNNPLRFAYTMFGHATTRLSNHLPATAP
jgi:hypothetical protein